MPHQGARQSSFPDGFLALNHSGWQLLHGHTHVCGEAFAARLVGEAGPVGGVTGLMKRSTVKKGRQGACSMSPSQAWKLEAFVLKGASMSLIMHNKRPAAILPYRQARTMTTLSAATDEATSFTGHPCAHISGATATFDTVLLQ